jgi:hypothetical protein
MEASIVGLLQCGDFDRRNLLRARQLNLRSIVILIGHKEMETSNVQRGRKK